MAGAIPDHQSAEAAVSNQDVRPQSEHEPVHTRRLGDVDGLCQIVARVGIVQEIGRTPDSKRGVWPNRGRAQETGRCESPGYRIERRSGHRSGAKVGCSHHCPTNNTTPALRASFRCAQRMLTRLPHCP